MHNENKMLYSILRLLILHFAFYILHFTICL